MNPTHYTPELAAAILEAMCEGRSLRSICAEPGMPTESCVRGWARDDRDGFADRYERARVLQCEAIADEIIAISDLPKIGEKITNRSDGTVETVTGDMVERARLQVHARQWYLSKIAPKRFGDRVSHDVNVTISIAAELAIARQRAALLVETPIIEALPAPTESLHE